MTMDTRIGDAPQMTIGGKAAAADEFAGLYNPATAEIFECLIDPRMTHVPPSMNDRSRLSPRSPT